MCHEVDIGSDEGRIIADSGDRDGRSSPECFFDAERGRVVVRSRWRIVSTATSCGTVSVPVGAGGRSCTRSSAKGVEDTAIVRRAARSAASRAGSFIAVDGDEAGVGGDAAGDAEDGDGASIGTGLYPMSRSAFQIRSTRTASCTVKSSLLLGVPPWSTLVRTCNAMLLCMDARNWASATTRFALRTVLLVGVPALILSRRTAGFFLAGPSAGGETGLSCVVCVLREEWESLWK